jgi:thioredoxin 1
MLSPLFKQMEKDMVDVLFETIDVDEDPIKATEYNVRSVPTVLVFKDGEHFASLVGAASKNEYVSLIEEVRNA